MMDTYLVVNRSTYEEYFPLSDSGDHSDSKTPIWASIIAIGICVVIVVFCVVYFYPTEKAVTNAAPVSRSEISMQDIYVSSGSSMSDA